MKLLAGGQHRAAQLAVAEGVRGAHQPGGQYAEVPRAVAGLCGQMFPLPVGYASDRRVDGLRV
jgi:hypothetical protein